MVHTQQFVVTHEKDYFFRRPRTQTFCESLKPDDRAVQAQGDYGVAMWMKHFFDGTIDMTLQCNAEGLVILNVEDAERTMRYKNPLRDPPVLVRRDGMYALRDGFHRVLEAKARKYQKQVWCIVLDMDAASDG